MAREKLKSIYHWREKYSFLLERMMRECHSDDDWQVQKKTKKQKIDNQGESDTSS